MDGAVGAQVKLQKLKDNDKRIKVRPPRPPRLHASASPRRPALLPRSWRRGRRPTRALGRSRRPSWSRRTRLRWRACRSCTSSTGWRCSLRSRRSWPGSTSDRHSAPALASGSYSGGRLPGKSCSGAAGAPTARPLLPGGAQLRLPSPTVVAAAAASAACVACWQQRLSSMISGFGTAQFSGVPPPMSTRGGAKMCLRRLETRLKDGRRSSRRRGSSNCSWLIRARYNTKRRLSSFRGAQI